jgi:hypothetical protein
MMLRGRRSGTRAAPACTAARALRRAAIACLAALGLGAAGAAESGPTWNTLSASQQQALSPLRHDWSGLDAARKQQWLEVAARFPTLPQAERERIQARMTEWAQMSPSERGRARLQFQSARQWSPQERQARWQAYQALPDADRRALLQRAQQHRAAPDARAGATVSGKRNIVTTAPPTPAPRAVAPSLVQVGPGATTTLVSTPPDPPAHQQPGMPKIVATEGFVNPETLLPRRGAQAAAVTAPAERPRERAKSERSDRRRH